MQVKLLRRKWTSLFTLCYAVCGCTPAASSEEQATAPAAVTATCAIGVAAVVSLDSSGGDRATRPAYAAILASPRGPGAATGHLWINTSGGAFRVQFIHREVLSGSLEGEVDPIAFRLPANALLENAFVSELTRHDQSGDATCAIFDPWTHASNRNVRADRMQQFMNAPRTTISDAQVIADPQAECKAPNVPARTLHVASPAIPPIAQQQGITGVVTILVRLDVKSDVIATKLVASPSELLIASALTAASTSIFRTAVERCRPIPTTFMFHVEFSPSP